MYTVYILYSFVHDRTYTGYTIDLIQRFYSHNKYNNTDWTKKYRPWVVIHFEVFEEKKEAIKREQQLKSGKNTASPINEENNDGDHRRPFEP